MSRRVLLGYGLLVAAISLPVAASVSRCATARETLGNARAELQRVRGEAARVESLRASDERVAMARHPDTDVSLLVRQIISDAGIEPQVRNVDTASDRRIPGSGGYARHDIRVVLSRLSLSDLGAFCDRFRSDGAPWKISGIEIAHSTRADESHFDVSLTLSTLYPDH